MQIFFFGVWLWLNMPSATTYCICKEYPEILLQYHRNDITFLLTKWYRIRYIILRYMTDRLLKLYIKIKNSPTNVSFLDLCKLAEEVGFVFRSKSGSHSIYKHPIYGNIMNFQPDKRNKSKAKKYQVSQLIDFIDDNKVVKEG